ncbi:uncharacterized protein LOC110026146 [Phalaenopsis equestris]|uniref:uncharacterized protein LOC110026146 n=1 Tax=Phalaenopsis equestris TaxID=78828 RepID=UPI0009E2CE55|nr:uncharacterized protein LOC110026146 [Phalaenopsis equestris]
MGKRRRRCKRMKVGDPSSPTLYPSLDLKTFPLMLAAASTADAQNPIFRSLLKRLLSAHYSLLTPPTCSLLPLSILLPPCLLALLPLLLASSCPSLAVLSAQLVGAASLCSLEANSMIVLDKEIVNELLRAVVSRSRSVAVAACNAVLDLSVSSNGRETLRREFLVIEKLLSLLNQVNDSPKDLLSLVHDEKCDTPVALVLDAALILINTSDEDRLQSVPHELIENFLPLLKVLWENSYNSNLTSNLHREHDCVHRKKYDLAAALFRLSMDHVPLENWKAEELIRGIFGVEKFTFENFILDHWEVSPLVFKGTWNSLEGSQIIYGQDIRVLKTLTESMHEIGDEEVHFFKDSMEFDLKDEFIIQKFKEALQDGFTIALRGMEFRNSFVAAITEMLSNLLGQPSAGANIYLTPPKSQGLARHFDDHCVFVWQIFGKKQWRILPRSENFIPRLYEPLGSLQSSSRDEGGYMDVLIKEGDVLYIPRGFRHEAHTIFNVDESKDSDGQFSLHLTLGVEIEPPFEWEGFTHIAIHCWSQKKQKHNSIHPIDSELLKLRRVLVNMLHVAVRLTADKNTVLKKASLITSPPFSSNIRSKQKATFHHIINTINVSSIFWETFNLIVTAVRENNEDYLQWMRWLRHLCPQNLDFKNSIFDKPLELFKEFVLLNCRPLEEVMDEFSQVKSDFCTFVVFEDACDELSVLLQKYRKTRQQYMKGMLSL